MQIIGLEPIYGMHTIQEPKDSCLSRGMGYVRESWPFGGKSFYLVQGVGKGLGQVDSSQGETDGEMAQ